MQEYRVRSFAELHDALDHHRRDAGWAYRGHADPDWELVPRAGRPPFAGGADEIFFKGMTPLDRMDRIVIDHSYRRELLFELNQYGVNAQTLFPNLVELSRHFNWIVASFDYWAEGLTGVKRDTKEIRG